MKSPFSHQFKWVSLFRIIAVSVIGGIGIYFLREQLQPLWLIIASTYFLTLIYWLSFRKNIATHFILWTGVVLDAFIVTAMVHFTGGIESELTFLYFLPIIAASTFFFLKGGAIIATLCLLNYGALLTLEFHKIIPSIFPVIPYDLYAIYLKFYLNATFFYLVATTAGYLGERFKQRGEALEQIKLDTDTILHSINSGIAVLDYNGNIIYKNKKLAEILSQPVKDNIKEVSPLKDWFSKLLSIGAGFTCDDGLPLQQEITLGRKILAINISALQTTRGYKRGIVLVIQDITDLRLTEELAIIGKFSANLAHELRNPVTAMQGPCELIKEGVSEKEKERLLSIIINQSQRLNNIISSFLAFAKPMPLHPELSEIGSLLLSAKEDILLEYTGNLPAIEIIQKSPISLNLDPEQIRCAFSNLILNAVQVLNGNGELQIEVLGPEQRYNLFVGATSSCDPTCDTVPKNEALVCFKDTGPGIPEDVASQIFTPFYTTKPDGVGLGLCLVSKIIENHKGKIEVKSKLNKGTTFILHLPTT